MAIARATGHLGLPSVSLLGTASAACPALLYVALQAGLALPRLLLLVDGIPHAAARVDGGQIGVVARVTEQTSIILLAIELCNLRGLLVDRLAQTADFIYLAQSHQECGYFRCCNCSRSIVSHRCPIGFVRGGRLVPHCIGAQQAPEGFRPRRRQHRAAGDAAVAVVVVAGVVAVVGVAGSGLPTPMWELAMVVDRFFRIAEGRGGRLEVISKDAVGFCRVICSSIHLPRNLRACLG